MKKQFILMLLLMMLSGCGEGHKVRDDNYFKTAKVHYIIDGKKYAVPMGYHWWQHIKYNQWPTPKEEYTVTTSFGVDALLPDFIPYSNENAARFDDVRGRGDLITISVSSLSGRHRPLEQIINIWKETGNFDQVASNPEVSQLNRYLRKPGENSSEDSWKNVYLSTNFSHSDFWIECDVEVPSRSPACTLYDYGGISGPAYESVFALKYLPHWQDIRERSAALINSFIVQ